MGGLREDAGRMVGWRRATVMRRVGRGRCGAGADAGEHTSGHTRHRLLTPGPAVDKV